MRNSHDRCLFSSFPFLFSPSVYSEVAVGFTLKLDGVLLEDFVLEDDCFGNEDTKMSYDCFPARIFCASAFFFSKQVNHVSKRHLLGFFLFDPKLHWLRERQLWFK